MLRRTLTGALILAVLSSRSFADDADLILHNGKVVTADAAFSVRQALAETPRGRRRSGR